MKIILTGASSPVGNSLRHYLSEVGHILVPVDITTQGSMEKTVIADLRDKNTVLNLVENHKPDLILHLAAITDLNYCEQHKFVAHLTNYGITETLVEACGRFGVPMVFFSSDYVFGKYDRLWGVDDNPCPTTQYGIDKAASESVIQKHLTEYAILRTAQLYGFQGDFVNLVYKTLSSGRQFKAFSNLVNCPTWIGDLFPMVNKIIQNRHNGVFHCVGPEPLSRYQYACAVAEAYALDAACIEPVDLDFSKDIRPPIVRLDGTSTYEALQIYPGTSCDNIAKCTSVFS